ncbi:hypothetical protein ATANTOWER_002908 [Ataeniobius toweri]|uniref:Uncharacterized protein n=1 Tax=Ataeniobius toweri TaxID=208326 RepID=A0ABU7CHM9_9TELE|nr:hypothetical protein [Ataeniobius toweri]
MYDLLTSSGEGRNRKLTEIREKVNYRNNIRTKEGAGSYTFQPIQVIIILSAGFSLRVDRYYYYGMLQLFTVLRRMMETACISFLLVKPKGPLHFLSHLSAAPGRLQPRQTH